MLQEAVSHFTDGATEAVGTMGNRQSHSISRVALRGGIYPHPLSQIGKLRLRALSHLPKVTQNRKWWGWNPGSLKPKAAPGGSSWHPGPPPSPGA